MRDRNARGRGRGYRRGHARNDLELYIFLFQRLYLLAAASEDEGVAALEAHDVLSFERFFDEYLLYLALRHGVASAFLADVYLLCALGHHREHSVADEPVEYYRVGALHDLAPAQRQQPRVSRARADEPNLAGRHHFPSLSLHARPRASSSASSGRPQARPSLYIPSASSA